MSIDIVTLAHERTIAPGANFRTRMLPSNTLEFGMCAQVTFQLVVTAVNGGPSSWSWGGRLQIGVDGLTGPAFTSAPIWRDLTPLEYARHSATGGPFKYGANTPPTIFTNSDGTNKIAQITITDPPDLLTLLMNDPVMADGTTPSLTFSAFALCDLPD